MYNVVKFHDYSENEFINENIIIDTKNKVINWWRSFQNKEELCRKILKFIENGNYALIFIYILYIFLLVFDFKKDFIIKHNEPFDFIIILVYFIFTILKGRLPKFRQKLIKDKLTELRNRFMNNTFKDSIFMILGDRKDINLVIDKLKNDKILNDDGILQTDDITLIDLSEQFKHYNVKHDDPYGEEIWEDEMSDYYSIKKKTIKKEYIIDELGELYNVRFRKIMKLEDLGDKIIMKKNKNKNQNRYLRLRDEYINYINYYDN